MSKSVLRTRLTAGILTLVTLSGTAGTSLAQGNIRVELAALAKSIHGYLQGRGDDSVGVGQFSGPPDLAASAGPAIAKVMTDELTRLGLTVKRRANLTLEGKYRGVEDVESGHLAVALETTLTDRNGKVVLDLEKRGIFGEQSVSALLGLTVDLPPGADPKTRDKELKKGADNPKIHIRGSRIAASPNSPYAVEVLIKKKGDDYEPRAARNDEGLAFVPIQRQEIYAITLYNDADHEAAVTLTIDGLNMFTFSDIKDDKNRPKYSVIIVAPKSSTTIKGWHRNNEVSNEFKVTAYAESAAAELHSSANIGTITASFAACWAEGSKPPADEPVNAHEFSRSADATARGAEFKMQFKEVKRTFGVVRSAVSVRYSK